MAGEEVKFRQVADSLQGYVLLEGGELFASGDMEEVNISKSYAGRGAIDRSHAEITGSYEREEDADKILGLNYLLHQGITKVLDCFPNEVLTHAEIDPDEIDPDEELCVNDCITYDLSPHHRTIEVTRVATFILDEIIVLSAPHIGGKFWYDPDIQDRVEPVVSKSESGISIVEYVIPGQDNMVLAATVPQLVEDEFEAIVGSLDSDITEAEKTLNHITEIMSVLRIPILS